MHGWLSLLKQRKEIEAALRLVAADYMVIHFRVGQVGWCRHRGHIRYVCCTVETDDVTIINDVRKFYKSIFQQLHRNTVRGGSEHV